MNSFPVAPSPVVRQIREEYWTSGEAHLHNNPDLNEVEVFFYHWSPDMRWDFKVVRIGERIVRQTWLNGSLMLSE